ncbi:MAG: hypothetical protein MK095_02675 [Phycisphaerales bacterium]|nr:hypothetical protein [Phycisphaerales bacterium]
MRFVIPTLVSVLAFGCAPYGSYPPVEKTASLTDMTFEPVPSIITTSIEWAKSKETGIVAEGPVTFTLPAGSSQESYEQIQERMNGTAQGSDDATSIAIKSVRVRGFEATVDLSIPRSSGRQPLLYTIQLKSMPFESWKVVEERRWRFSQDALTQSGKTATAPSDLAEAERE